MIFKSGCHNKQLTFGRLISLCKNINRAGGLSIRQPATFFTVRVQTGSDWGYFWGYLRKLNEYNSLKINWMFSDVMFLLSHHSSILQNLNLIAVTTSLCGWTNFMAFLRQQNILQICRQRLFLHSDLRC